MDHPLTIAGTRTIVIKRCWGLGNVICLLPVLDQLCLNGYDVEVITAGAWLSAFAGLRPRVRWTADDNPHAIDLDADTAQCRPNEHRTDEFARLLGVPGPFPSTFLDVPRVWSDKFDSLRGSVVFAPEAGHASRAWPLEQARQLKSVLPNASVVLVGTRPEPSLPCDLDTRGELTTEDLFGLLAGAGAVVTMDSAVLHIAAGLGKPTVALFGGVDPRFRTRPQQPVVVLQADLDCCPCNKDETCNDAFPCIGAPQVGDVIAALQQAQSGTARVIERIDCATSTL